MLKSAVRTVKATASEAKRFTSNTRNRATEMKLKEEEAAAWYAFEEAQQLMDARNL